MDVLTAILSCALHNDPALVRAIVHSRSKGYQFRVGDLHDNLVTDSARTAAEADAIVLEVREKGHAVAVGLMGVRPEWAATYGRSPGQLWGVCANVEVGTAKLSDFDYQCRGGKAKRGAIASPQNRACILGKYASALGLPKSFLSEVYKDIYSRPSPAAGAEDGDRDDDLTAGDLDGPDEGAGGGPGTSAGRKAPESSEM
jgi:hypothetical protein